MKTLSEIQRLWLYTLLSFAFAVAMRLVWIYHFDGYEPFYFNGQLMINTNDGYYFAEGARDILAGFHQPNDLSPTHEAMSLLTALFVKILPFSFETILLYMPIVLSSLVVIPMMFIAKRLGNLEIGFGASLLAGIAWSYYNRTMAGYYDTDMLNIVLALFTLYYLIDAFIRRRNSALLGIALSIALYMWWYNASYALSFSLFGLIVLYTLLYERRNSYLYQLLSMMMIGLIGVPIVLKLILIAALFVLFTQERFERYWLYVLGACVVVFMATGGLDPITLRLKGYVFKEAIESSGAMGLHFFSVMQTVREAGSISFETFANRISGHTATFILSLIGYGYLVYRHRVMLLMLPLVGLGFIAMSSGLRFTIYAVVPLAFGFAFLIHEIVRFIEKRVFRALAATLLYAMALYPNIAHIDSYRVPTVFNADEVRLLDQLKHKADREDYVVAWWDYGYPIRYYTDMKTLIDGGKHSGSVNFAVSYMLTHPQEASAKLARLEVEFTERAFEKSETRTNIEAMSEAYGLSDANDFLTLLRTDMELPQKSRDVYLYLPYRMLEIYPTVASFSNLDLMSGEQKKQPFYFISRNARENGSLIELGGGVAIERATMSIRVGDQNVKIRRFAKTAYDNEMRLQKEVELIDFGGALSVIYMQNYNTFLVLDEATYNSLYIQLMVLEEYDRNLFEIVLANPHAKIYRLKI